MSKKKILLGVLVVLALLYIGLVAFGAGSEDAGPSVLPALLIG
jgi:hypothetical protein